MIDPCIDQRGLPISLVVTEAESGKRVDQIVAIHVPSVRRSQFKDRMTNLCVNGKTVKLATRASAGDRITACILDQDGPAIKGEDIPLSILHEEDQFVVIDKAQGMVVHPGAGNHHGTLVHALIGRYGDTFPGSLDGTGERAGTQRPGVVHRLDKETSGVLIVARTEQTHAWLVDQFAQRRTEKTYLAIVKGCPKGRLSRLVGAIGRDPNHRTRYTVRSRLSVEPMSTDECESQLLQEERDGAPVPVGAKYAETWVRVLACYNAGYALVRLRPITGRTHQLRVHLHAWGHPILGDPLYARRDPRFPEVRMMLHAMSLSITPTPGSESRTFATRTPTRYRDVLQQIRT